MTKPRTELQELLVSVLGSEFVYFQSPPSTGMHYPCILYKRDDVKIDYADDQPYTHRKRYLVTVIDRNPDSTIPDKLAKLPSCVFDRFYVADGLNHDAYKLFF